jgi:glycosyltransferase involved in cell wall biosynthesis
MPEPVTNHSSAPGISIAMCTYNGEQHLESQLTSIAEQSLPPSELVICDDGSTDATVSILLSFMQNAPFKVRLVRNDTNLGSTANFERAIRLCEHEFIALSDQDDIWFPNKLEILANILMEKGELGGLFSDGVLLTPDGAPDGRSLWDCFGFNFAEQQKFRSGRSLELLLRGNKATGMTMMFRASLRDRLLPIPGSWIHDYWLAFMLCIHSSLGACPQRLVSYRLHSSQSIGAPETFQAKTQRIAAFGLAAYFECARRKSKLEYARVANQLDDLERYLEELDNSSFDNLRSHVREKAVFCHTLAQALTTTRPPRLKTVLGFTPQYRIYTNLPWRGILRDITL